MLFKQRRYGLDGREIILYKFRSMTIMHGWATQYTQVTRHGSRVPPFGAFIRKFSLDELPQLFNVLRGNLSIVDPRPHAVAVNKQYRKLIPGYMVRHKVKPGITGGAQINGYRGGDDLESMRKRIEFDLNYLRNRSLGLDFSIKGPQQLFGTIGGRTDMHAAHALRSPAISTRFVTNVFLSQLMQIVTAVGNRTKASRSFGLRFKDVTKRGRD